MGMLRWFHRANVPEKDAETIRDAWAHHDGIECDVRFTADHVPVLVHDVLDEEETWDDLQATGVRRLVDALREWPADPARQRTIMLEIKAVSCTEDEEALHDALQSVPDLLDDIVVASFDESFLARWDATKVMYLTCNLWIRTPDFLLYPPANLTHIGLSLDVLTPAWADAVRRQCPQCKIMVFTVRTPMDTRLCHQCSVHGYIRD